MGARRRMIVFLGGALALFALAVWAIRARRNPAACPYGQRFVLEAPRPFLSRTRLAEALAPAPGERLLEVGPGTGYYTLDVARRIGPGGRLDILDLQTGMLEETLRRARAEGFANIAAVRGDAQALPYRDGTFAGAFLVATLGETPDHDAALRELRRVLAPGGRLVVGEGQPDPHMVRFPDLQGRAARAGLAFERRLGGPLGYVARFRPA